MLILKSNKNILKTFASEYIVKVIYGVSLLKKIQQNTQARKRD